jgi:hypothetical protein
LICDKIKEGRVLFSEKKKKRRRIKKKKKKWRKGK